MGVGAGILAVAQYRRADRHHVGAELVRPSGPRPQRDPGEPLPRGFEDRIERDRRTAALRVGGYLLPALAADLAQRPVDLALARVRHADGDRPVDLAGVAAAERIAQQLRRTGVAGEQEIGSAAGGERGGQYV